MILGPFVLAGCKGRSRRRTELQVSFGSPKVAIGSLLQLHLLDSWALELNPQP